MLIIRFIWDIYGREIQAFLAWSPCMVCYLFSVNYTASLIIIFSQPVYLMLCFQCILFWNQLRAYKLGWYESSFWYQIYKVAVMVENAIIFSQIIANGCSSCGLSTRIYSLIQCEIRDDINYNSIRDYLICIYHWLKSKPIYVIFKMVNNINFRFSCNL